MTNLKIFVLVLLISAAGEFLAGFFGLDSTRFLAGFALFLAIRSELRIDELEEV